MLSPQEPAVSTNILALTLLHMCAPFPSLPLRSRPTQAALLNSTVGQAHYWMSEPQSSIRKAAIMRPTETFMLVLSHDRTVGAKVLSTHPLLYHLTLGSATNPQHR